ncbi:MAG TPA: hypothetical protein VGY66_32390 [Gemmataceae bacterium]|nr:hypothetical protein [Gemmataceae bacterium]
MLAYYVFDLLHLDGHDLRDLPLLRRKELLATILDDLPDVKFKRAYPGARHRLLSGGECGPQDLLPTATTIDMVGFPVIASATIAVERLAAWCTPQG